MNHAPRSALAACATALLLLLPSVADAKAPIVHAHRGGSYVSGVPTFPENTMPAFLNAAKKGYVIELDVKLTKDGVPVVIHDATLDRTTPCTGQVNARTFAELRAECPSDILGTDGNFVQLAAGDRRRAAIPKLSEVFALARLTGARLNLEIKNQPGDPDFDTTSAFADKVLDEIQRSGFPLSRLIVQSFWFPNLDRAEERLPGVETSLLALGPGSPDFTDRNGYDWLSAQWPAASTTIARAHELGLRVVPFTIDARDDIAAAARLGVDELITNDPLLARKTEAEVEGTPAPIPPPPSAATCRAVRAHRSLGTIAAYGSHRHGLRVFAMQLKQEARHVETYASFRTKIECLIRERVVPRLAHGAPNVVAFNEDVGLMTLGTGSRGAEARAIVEDPESVCPGAVFPCATVSTLLSIKGAYADEVAAYKARFPSLPFFGSVFTAGTDTFARGWMQVFSDMARRYGLYILGSNNQSPFRESVDPSEIERFRDPDLPVPDSVFVATSPKAYNEAFLWAPYFVRREGPRPLRNVVSQNRKVPLTDIEQVIDIAPGPSTGPDAVENLRPFRVPGSRARIGFATSLPAFVYGDPPVGVDPCSDTSKYYMRCLDRLGTNLVMQDEANPGPWVTDPPFWQPLDWMRSTWRAASDPTVHFDYNVTPFMVGQLGDLVFDGQTAITQRGLRGRSCTYVGNTQFLPGPPDNDDPSLEPYAGRKEEFLALAPWVVPDAPRPELRAVAARLAPGSGDALENDYVETAIAADLPFPAQPRRRNCISSPGGHGHG
jgi:glycerophosphoryl diester phosphodiesterase